MADENKLDKKGRPVESPRPVARPDRSKPRLIDSTAVGEDGVEIDIKDNYNPITALGMSTGDSFRQLPAELTARGAYTPPAKVDDVEYMGGRSPAEDIQKFYSREKPDAKPIQIDDVTLMGEAGLNPQTAAHEFMHKGFEQLRGAYDLDTLTDLIGEKSAKILLNPAREHLLVQAVLEKETGNSYNDYFKEQGLTEDSVTLVRETADKLYGLTNGILEKQGFYVEKPHGKPSSIPEPESEGFWGGLKKAVGFAEGGLAMDDQMEMVFKSSRDESDPVSGNEVPTGAMPEEVRDDIPAQLSEGEYVVPADVLRYYGVKFFEDLRSQAKQGWQELDEGGRVGGEPMGMEMGEDELPFDISELQVVEDEQMAEQPEMNQGGYIDGYAEGGVVTEMATPDFMQGSTPEAVSSEFRVYTNGKGQTITIRFVNGQPASPIPTGYSLVSDTASAPPEEAPSSGGSGRDSSPAPQDKPKPVDWDKADPALFNATLDRQQSMLYKGGKGLLSAALPPAGMVMGMVERSQYKDMLSSLDKRLKDETPGSTSYEELNKARDRIIKTQDKNKDGAIDNWIERKGVFGQESGLTKNLKDTDDSGKVGFGDTWLGDLLGMDEKGFGVQGPGLKESKGGARRSGGDSSPAPSATPSEDGGSNSLVQSAKNFFTPNDGKSYVGGKLEEDKD